VGSISHLRSSGFQDYAESLVKGTASRDFLHPVFLINQLILVPLEMSMGHLSFLLFHIALLK